MTMVSPPRRALNALALASAFALAPLVFEQPPWVFGFFALGLAWRYAHAYRGIRLPGWWLRAALMLLAVAMVWRHHGTLIGRDPGLALLVALLGLKCLELRSLRDYLLVMFLLYLVLAGGLLYEASLPAGLWAAAATVVNLAALARLNQPQALTLRQALALAGGIVLKALPIMLVLYLLFPRLSGALWGVPAGTEAALSGVPETLRLGEINRLSLSDEVALRIEFEDERLPPARERYWRARVLTHTDGREWTAAPQSEGTAAPITAFEGFGPPWRYTVHLEPNPKPWLYVLGLPAELPAGARLAAGLTLESTLPVVSRLSYRLRSFTRYRTGALAPAERAAALQLPTTLDPRVRALAARLLQAARSGGGREIAQAALAYFRDEGFSYTLMPPPTAGQDPVAAFLFETRRGYCEHYAAAFATLMRAAGVPSRIVLGYQGGELNPAGGYLVVRQADAHAWVEIWTPEGGWERVDPTAVVAPERVELGIEALRRLSEQGFAFGRLPEPLLARVLAQGWFARLAYGARAYWDYANLAWYRWVAGYDEARRRAALERLGLAGLETLGQAGLIVFAVAALLLAYVLAAGPWRAAWGQRRRQDPAARLYARFCRKLARAGMPRAPHEGPLAYAERVRMARPALGAAVDEIVQRYVRLRYAPPCSWRGTASAVRAAPDQDEADRRRAELRALARAVARLRPGSPIIR